MKWLITFMICIGLIAAIVGWSPAVRAEDPIPERCYPTTRELSDLLKQRYGEEPYWLGVNGKPGLVMVFAKPDGSSWTLVFVDQSGLSCVVTGGDVWVPRNAKTEEDA